MGHHRELAHLYLSEAGPSSWKTAVVEGSLGDKVRDSRKPRNPREELGKNHSDMFNMLCFTQRIAP